jgi:hypothetical protein
VHFLNAYWQEIGSQGDFIFQVAWETMKQCDMHSKGVSLIHLYEEGSDLDFNIGLYFYEQLCLKVLERPEGAKWRNDPKYKPSMPSMMTALVRKQELREKVDVNFDGRVSFLEYLLYQYRAFCNPADFIDRAMKAAGMMADETMDKCRAAIDEVNDAIRAYEREKARLEAESRLPGVKGLGAKHTLTMLVASPLAENLQVALVKAEGALRMAQRAMVANAKAASGKPQGGAMFWMGAELNEKKRLYGKA